VEAFRTAATIEPERAETHVNLGIALADTADLEGALKEFNEAVRLAPQSAIAHYNRGRVLGDMNRDAEAKTEVETAVRLNGGDAEWWSTLGAMARKTGDKEESLHGFRRAVELEEKSAKRRYELGQALRDAGDMDGAVVRWREALALNPEYADALYALSRALTRTQPEEAKRLQARFLRLQTLQRAMDEAQTLGNEALSAAAGGDWATAIAQLKTAISTCGECSVRPMLHKNLGLIYCRAGDLKNGETELVEADALMPGDEDIARALRILRSR
jgi:tetratricopeptide (TPR) repeat protein